jgi:hypothetical protein
MNVLEAQEDYFPGLIDLLSRPYWCRVPCPENLDLCVRGFVLGSVLAFQEWWYFEMGYQDLSLY